jgi:hypothetical protein
MVTETQDELITSNCPLIQLAKGLVAGLVHSFRRIYVRVSMPVIAVILEDCVDLTTVTIDFADSRDKELALRTESVLDADPVDGFN